MSIFIFSKRCGVGINGASPKVNERITSKEKGILSNKCILQSLFLWIDRIKSSDIFDLTSLCCNNPYRTSPSTNTVTNLTERFSFGNWDLSLGRIKLVYREFEKYVPYEFLIPGDKGLYAAKNCWYADLVAYRELGRGMTGATYAVMPYGPQLDNYAGLVDEILKVDNTSTAEPLNEQEISIISKLSGIYTHQRTAFDASHAEPEWKAIKSRKGQKIPYRIAHKITAC